MIPDEKLRAWWAHRQGLDGSLAGKSPSEILSRSGWARSVAGASPYLTFFSRGGLSRVQIDDLVARAEIHELPAARGCTYVLPAADYALGLKLGQPFTEKETKVAGKLGVTAAELDLLQKAVVDALDAGPLDTEGIRSAVGSAARSLGPEGAKKGITTTLPVALGILQSAGEIRRIPFNGRLDHQRYRYARWRPNPLAACGLTEAEALTELGRRYFAWAGPASLAEFQWFSGVSLKAVQAAAGPLDLATVDTAAGPRLLLRCDTDAFEHFEAPAKPHYSLVGSLDSHMALRRNLPSLVAAEDAGRVCGRQGMLDDLSDHGIFDRGRLVGLWQFEPQSASIVWTAFAKPDAELREAVRATEAFVRDELGDARRGSLDSPASRAPRIEAIRKAGVL